MNAPVKMGLLQREGFTVLKRGVVEKDAGNGGGKRTGLDDDPSRWDEPGALLFMALYPNNRDDFPYYGDAPKGEERKDALCAEAAIWTGLGSSREQHHERVRDWHMGDPDNTEERLEANIEKFEKEGTSLGADFLYSYSKMQPYAQNKRLEEASLIFAEPVPLEYSSDAPPLGGDADDPAAHKSKLFDALLWDQIGQSRGEVRELVEDTITWGGLSVWYGEPNVGKSFVVSYLAMCVALGWRWHGREVERAGVLFVACEGGTGQQQRAIVFRQHHGEEKTRDARFALIPGGIVMRDKREVAGLIETARELAPRLGGRVGLIVIDTLNLALAGGNENASEDMGALIAGANKLREATGAHIALIHHCGKDSTKGARGHSSLRGATDSEFLIERPDANGPIVVKSEKQRDLDRNRPPLAFQLRRVGLGTNQWGKATTSCVVEPVETLQPKAKRLSDDAQTALGVLRELLPESGDSETTVRVDDWRRVVYAAFGRDGFKNTSTLRSKFNRARDTLAAAGSIEIRGDDMTVPWTAWTGQEKREGAE